MDSVLLAVLSCIFGLLCIGREVCVILRSKRIRISNLFLIMYGMTYGVVLSLLLVLELAGIYRADGVFLQVDYSPEGVSRLGWWFLAAVAGYAAFRLGFALRNARPVRWRLTLGAGADRGVRRTVDAGTRERLLLGRLQITAFVCFAVGLVCFVIWARGWGGYSNLFLNAASIRNGSYGLRNPLAFFAKPAQIVATVSVIALLLIRRKVNVGINVLLFLCSFAVALLYYSAKDGRMVMAMYLLIIFFMGGDIFGRKAAVGRKLAWLAALFVLFVAVVLNMDRLLKPLRGVALLQSADATVLEDMLDELSYIYVAGQTAVEDLMTHGSPMLLGHDIAQALFAWVPSAFTPDGLIDVWDYNTSIIAAGRVSAQFPTDMISTSLYDLGLLGPVLLPFAWGLGVSWLERRFRDRNSPLTEVVYCSLSMTLVRVVDYCNLYYTVASVFHLFVAMVIFWIVRRLKWR